ncbi:MAG: hypothetical protein QOG99_1063, partial [Frankiales bacterium]|nr:hypothetical protein [Frankiales bacterium]
MLREPMKAARRSGSGALRGRHTVRRVSLNPLICVAEVGQADAIAAVHVETWRVAYSGLLPQHVLDGLSVQRRGDGWREILRTQDGHTLVAVDAETGRVRGFTN